MSSGSSLSLELSERTFIFGLKVWVLIGIIVGVFIILILSVIPICLTVRKKYKRVLEKLPLIQIHPAAKEIKEVNVEHVSANNFIPFEGILLTIHDKSSNRNSDKVMIHLGKDKIKNADNSCQFGSFNYMERDGGSQSGEGGSSQAAIVYRPSSSVTTTSLLTGLPEFSQLGWGHWFTLRDLELATNCFSRENILGEGGYGIVYHGQLSNGTPVAVKRILNNLGQAEKEFRVEVDAIGHVRHRNLVRLLGYCMEGTQRILVYEYVNNGNLDQWLHGAMCQRGYLTWEARMKVLLGTAKALSYLHEAIEPKVVHRDIKSSNILIDENFDAKVSDFGMAKLLGSGESHITTRVMGTFGYVAPEYANTGLLNEKSDIYSFGVVLLEAITGRDPVNHDRPADEKQDYHAQDATVGTLISSVQCFFPTECTSLIGSRFINVLATVLAFDLPELQVNLVDWVKIMVGCRRSEEVVDPKIETRPSTRAIKRALLIALRCIDPDLDKRPKMSRVVRILESEEYPFPREDRRHGRARADGIMDVESHKENSDTDGSNNPG